MKQFICLVLLVSVIFSGCDEKELPPEPKLHCTDFISALLENDSIGAGIEINAFLHQFTANPKEEDEHGYYTSFMTLIDEINACPTLQVKTYCYFCIYEDPPQSEMTISVTEEGQEITRLVDLGFQEGKLSFLEMHDIPAEEEEHFFYEETQCANPWNRGYGLSDSTLIAEVSKFLKDRLSVFYSDLSITHDGFVQSCRACSCTTGRVIRIKANKYYKEVLKENGFRVGTEVNLRICLEEEYQNPDWITEDFKRQYTIQLPENYEGNGMVGFEGNIFNKDRPDGELKVTYEFCGPTFCDDFGDPLVNPAPPSIIAEDENGNEVVLDVMKEICLKDETVGILYHNLEKKGVAKYFILHELEFRESVTIYFKDILIQEMEGIIMSISKVED